MSTEAKFVHSKGQGYKERLVRLLNICLRNELLPRILTVMSKRFQGKYSNMYVDLKPLLQLIFYDEHQRYFSGHMSVQRSR